MVSDLYRKKLQGAAQVPGYALHPVLSLSIFCSRSSRVVLAVQSVNVTGNICFLIASRNVMSATCASSRWLPKLTCNVQVIARPRKWSGLPVFEPAVPVETTQMPYMRQSRSLHLLVRGWEAIPVVRLLCACHMSGLLSFIAAQQSLMCAGHVSYVSGCKPTSAV